MRPNPYVLRGRRSRLRASLRDYAAERTHTPHAVMEAALAHAARNKAKAACARKDLFAKRRALIESDWDYLAA